MICLRGQTRNLKSFGDICNLVVYILAR